MSLYIHAENQAILWQILQTVPALQTFQCSDKPTWFRSIVSNFYEANKFKSFSSSELQQMNRDTIAYMVRELNQAASSSSSTNAGAASAASTSANTTGTPTAVEPMHHTENLHSYSFANSFLPGTSAFESTDVAIHDNGASIPKMGVHPKTVTRNYLSQQKQSAVNERFTQRQQEYDTMIKGVAPKPIDFRQPMTVQDDGILENISDLVQKYRQERDLLSEPAPALPTPTALSRPVKTVAQIDRPMMRHSISRSTVAEPLVNELVDVTDLDLMEISTHKNVRWSETLEETQSFTEETHDEGVASAVEPFSIQVQALRQELKQFMDEMKQILGSSPIITNALVELGTLTELAELDTLTELAESKHRDQAVQHESIEC